MERKKKNQPPPGSSAGCAVKWHIWMRSRHVLLFCFFSPPRFGFLFFYARKDNKGKQGRTSCDIFRCNAWGMAVLRSPQAKKKWGGDDWRQRECFIDDDALSRPLKCFSTSFLPFDYWRLVPVVRSDQIKVRSEKQQKGQRHEVTITILFCLRYEHFSKQQ